MQEESLGGYCKDCLTFFLCLRSSYTSRKICELVTQCRRWRYFSPGGHHQSLLYSEESFSDDDLFNTTLGNAYFRRHENQQLNQMTSESFNEILRREIHVCTVFKQCSTAFNELCFSAGLFQNAVDSYEIAGWAAFLRLFRKLKNDVLTTVVDKESTIIIYMFLDSI